MAFPEVEMTDEYPGLFRSIRLLYEPSGNFIILLPHFYNPVTGILFKIISETISFQKIPVIALL